MTIKEIQQSFISVDSFDFGEHTSAIAGLTIFTLLILVVITVRTLRARRLRYFPHGSISEPGEIREILRQAFDQRRPFEAHVQSDDNKRHPALRCSPEYIGNQSVTFELNGIATLSQTWVGRHFKVYFRLKRGENFTYYTFDSAILAIAHPAKGVCHITLAFPSTLDNRQKRSFLRMAPPQDLILGSALWQEPRYPAPESLHDINHWPPPSLLLLPSSHEQYRILDLSAGGVRLLIPRATVHELSLQFNAVEYLILLLDLFDPENGKRMRFWLQCRTKNVWQEHITHDISIGLQFLAWARAKDTYTEGETPGALEWLRLSSALEVDGIGNWIMRRHLELYRDMPAHLDKSFGTL